MQERLQLKNTKKLELFKPIRIEELKKQIKNYCKEICHRESIALKVYELIKSELDLESAVDIINNNDIRSCEDELTDIIRSRIIVFIELYAFGVEDGRSLL